MKSNAFLSEGKNDRQVGKERDRKNDRNGKKGKKGRNRENRECAKR